MAADRSILARIALERRAGIPAAGRGGGGRLLSGRMPIAFVEARARLQRASRLTCRGPYEWYTRARSFEAKVGDHPDERDTADAPRRLAAVAFTPQAYGGFDRSSDPNG